DYPGSVTWQWNFGDEASGLENTMLLQNSSHIFSSPGNFLVTLYINGGCATDTLTKFLKESVKPNASFTFYPDRLSATAPVSFTYTGTPATNWLWNFGDENISYDTDPVHIYKTPDTYEVLLYITDEFGCRDTAEASLDINEAPAVFVPGGFTPNDDGINDNFIIPSFGMSSCNIKIFDRWGNMIFHSSDPGLMNTQGWNGNVNGSKAQQGAYAYVLTGKLENGKPVRKEGFINLLR
ncbi:MAG TPA: PKD domain-containing protein, partial [Bacteroidia bacterium]|nr:PKD domain-containing protein [Bacteroidia bacterium]